MFVCQHSMGSYQNNSSMELWILFKAPSESACMCVCTCYDQQGNNRKWDIPPTKQELKSAYFSSRLCYERASFTFETSSSLDNSL